MRILMLGNSLTTAHDLPLRVADALGAEVVAHARGGARLAEHLNPATKLGAKTQAALANEQWDFVVLQEMSNGPVKFRERFLEATAALCDLIRASDAVPILYATWAYAPSCPKLSKLGLSHEQMHESMRDAFAEASERNHLPVAWACDAFFNAPEKEALYDADGVHPSTKGATVAAQVISDAIAACVQHDCSTNDGHRPIGNHDKSGTNPLGIPGSIIDVPKCIAPDIRRSEAPHCMNAPGAAPASHCMSAPDAAPDTASYFVYILRCADGSLYTGITTDVARRLEEHRSRGPKAARYTRTHPVVALEATWEMPDRATASHMEYRIKHLSHKEKESLIANPGIIGNLLQ